MNVHVVVMLVLTFVVTEGARWRVERCDTSENLDQEICQPWRKRSYNCFEKSYSGLLMDEVGLQTLQQQFTARRDEIMRIEGVSKGDNDDDGDKCCKTIYNHHKNTSLTNIYGRLRPIVHIPPNYQFIPHASCGDSGTCDGKCVIEPLILSLLTYNYSTGRPVFEKFIVPGYCSCKNIQNTP